MEAKAVCRRAMANPNLPEVERTQFVHRERQILAR
jgi:hypothetical protein